MSKISYLHPSIDVVTGLRNLADEIESGKATKPRYVTIVTSEEDVFTFGPESSNGLPEVVEVVYDLDRAKHFLHQVIDSFDGDGE